MNPRQSSSPPPETGVPTTGRLLGIDYGTKRVGIAISTPDQKIASPLALYVRRSNELDSRHFKTLIAEFQPHGIILGLPVHLNGDEGEKAKESRAYGRWLSKLSGLPVGFWDERLTSVAADEAMLSANLSREQRKKRLDMVAAQIMLQSYLDAKSRSREPGAANLISAQSDVSLESPSEAEIKKFS